MHIFTTSKCLEFFLKFIPEDAKIELIHDSGMLNNQQISHALLMRRKMDKDAYI